STLCTHDLDLKNMIFLISCKLILSKFFISWALDYSTDHFIFFFLVGIGVHKRNVRKCININLIDIHI
ncbi:MAG: hypothetical protein RR563_08060, partial [Acinetobacter sp.]